MQKIDIKLDLIKDNFN